MQFSSDLLRRCWFLAGATACGKTATGIELAQRLNAEVLSLDSMAIYRGMDIGTAKPTREEQGTVRHHLIDFLEPSVDFSVAEYLTAAQSVCETLLSRGKTPLFVGGTGLYLRSLLRGVFEGPSKDLEIRARLERIVAEHSPEALHARLAEVDAVTAARLHAQDVRRVVRALEVFELTGVPASAQLAEGPLPEAERPTRVFWLAPPRSWLHERINRRVDRMFAAGLVDEVRGLVASPGGLGRTASQALGYKEVVDHLNGELTLAQCVTQVKARTRQFAKRQETWFRNLVEAKPVAMSGGETPKELAERVMAMGGG
ncbi:MAG TPA: tRNA (adenosine(37)-N6)-dimethylallyltransferase MiaA [Caulifigura sp.]|nr:tRNA (adenosine(37)-N6)-dimethylallyltransferase MiaA [Caulifigura sp.]